MRLSQKGEYGLHALLELAQRYGEGPVQAGVIAESRRIPTQYLPQILLSLRRSGLIRSERGPRGGHELARPAAEITLLSALEALEGSIASASCGEPDQAAACAERDMCVLAGVWRRVDEATRSILGGITLADLASEERERRTTPMYYI